jgi:hypothetical protein
MTDLDQTSVPEAQSTEPVAISESMSFADYEKARRAGVKSVSDSAPVDKTEQKAAANSEAAETEEEEGDELEASEDASEESKKDKPKKGGFQRRIDKLNGKLAEERRAREALEARLAGYQPKQDEPKVVETAKQEGKPSPEAFETHAEYVEALTDWKIEQRESKAKQEAEKSRLMSEQEKVFSSHQERVKSFAEKHDDFQEALESVDDIKPSSALVELLVTSENGPELMYELSKNREEYERIAKLSPLAAARAMGQLEARLSKPSEEPKKEIKKLTSAPKPIEPVGRGTATLSKSLNDPTISFAEYEALRNKQLRSKK